METGAIVACRVCLATDTRLYAIRETGMEDAFVNITGFLFSPQEGFPSHLCPLCRTELLKCVSFRDRCERSHDLLEMMRASGPLKMSDINAVDRRAHKLTLDLTKVNIYKFDTSENIQPATVSKIEIDKGTIIINGAKRLKREQVSAFAIGIGQEKHKGNDVTAPFNNIDRPISKRESKGGSTTGQTLSKFSTSRATDYQNDHDYDVKIETQEDSIDTIDLCDEDIPLSSECVTRESFLPWPVLRPATKQKTDLVTSLVNKPLINDIDDVEGFMVFNSKAKLVTGITQKGSKKVGIEKDERNAIRKVTIESSNVTVGNTNGKIKNGTELLEGSDVGASFKLVEVVRGVKLVKEFDYEAFEKQCNVKRRILTEEEQRQEIETIKNSEDYLTYTYRCDLCGKRFNYKETYKNHMVYHDPSNGPYECRICHLRYSKVYKLRQHCEYHRVQFTCNECGHVTRGGRHRARIHFETHTGKCYKCPHCDRQYLRKVSLFNHMRILHPGENIACDECGETFVSAKGVLYHKNKTHKLNAIKPKSDFKCATCRIQFSDFEALNKHTSTAKEAPHLSYKPCVSCGENCRSDAALAAHAAECPRREKQLHCAECDVTFPNALSYDTHHRRKHLNQPSYDSRVNPKNAVFRRSRRRLVTLVCDICGKVYKSKLSLITHIKGVHQDLRPYECAYCGKAFLTKFRLELHIRTHTGAKPLQCGSCPQRFSSSGNLRRHFKALHSGVKSYMCNICGKAFGSSDGQKNHIRYVHMGEKAKPRVRQRKPRASQRETL